MANTVQISVISRYHRGVLRSGMTLGARKRWRNVVDSSAAADPLLTSCFAFEICPCLLFHLRAVVRARLRGVTAVCLCGNLRDVPQEEEHCRTAKVPSLEYAALVQNMLSIQLVDTSTDCDLCSGRVTRHATKTVLGAPPNHNNWQPSLRAHTNLVVSSSSP